MTKKRKQEVIAELTLSLNVVDVKFNETSENAAWCLGYLEGIVKQVILELEAGNK
jgi:hypothetical protein